MHAQLRIQKARIASVLMALAELNAEGDEQLKLDSLEGETDIHELVREILGAIEDDETDCKALASQIEMRTDRKRRLERRIEQRRTVLIELMTIADLDKLKLPEATLSTRTLKVKPKILDEAQLPEAYRIPTFKPDKEKIAEDFEDGLLIPGVVPDNGGTSITIRRR